MNTILIFKFLLPLMFIISSITNSSGQNQLIPIPVTYIQNDEIFALDENVNIDLRTENDELKKSVSLFARFLEGKGKKVIYEKSNKSIIISLNRKPIAEIGNEGYKLNIGKDAINLSANASAGIFNGLQTLRLLVPLETGNNVIQGCNIIDYPRFAWRGLMLDVSRHFFSKEDVKAYIDLMAQYKFNVFHWHLTDDNGWRIEIKSLPKLTEVGAWRVERYGRFGNRKDPEAGEAATYGGFYTHEDVREIVQYALDRNITIVPEIDVPGHSMAALAAYPELSCKKEPKMVNPGTEFAEWYGNGKFRMLIENTLNPSDEKVYEFLDKVFTEVADLFPGKYIHVGGDESYQGYWEEDPDCQALMKKNNLKNGHELQGYFMKRVEKIVSSKGKTMMGWDEILEGGLADGAAVMSWRGMEGGIEAAKMGHDVVMSPTTFTYLDYTQGDRTLEIPIYASLSLKKTYSFEPVPEGVKASYILGGQGNLWSEQIPTLRHAFYMTYPRAFAISEAVWSPKEKKDWDGFTKRVEIQFSRFESMQLPISKAIYDPIVTAKLDEEKLLCSITSDLNNVELFYTIDGTFPDDFSQKATGNIEIPEGDVTLKVVAYRDGVQIGRMLSITREQLKGRAR